METAQAELSAWAREQRRRALPLAVAPEDWVYAPALALCVPPSDPQWIRERLEAIKGERDV